MGNKLKFRYRGYKIEVNLNRGVIKVDKIGCVHEFIFKRVNGNIYEIVCKNCGFKIRGRIDYDSLKNKDNWSFAGDIKLYEYNIVKISEKAFSHDNSLKTIEIPDSVTSIGNYAFF